MALSDFEAAYLISGVNPSLLTEAGPNRTVKAGNMIGLCEQMNEMFGTKEYQGIIDFTELWMEDPSLGNEFLSQYEDDSPINHGDNTVGYFDTEGEKKAFIAARGQGDWYEQYEYAVGDR